jgi:hypothetical protein
MKKNNFKGGPNFGGLTTMKEELLWLREWESERELSYELDKWVDHYNRNYLHSALGYRNRCRPRMNTTRRRKILY